MKLIEKINRTHLIIIISTVLFAISCVGSKQLSDTKHPKIPEYRKLKSFESDTTAYLEYNFKNSKERYVGKPVKSLFADLEVLPLDFIPNESNLHADAVFGGAFLIRRGIDSKYIYISWMPSRLSFKLLKEIQIKHNFKWNDEMSKMIENQIITKILVYDTKITYQN